MAAVHHGFTDYPTGAQDGQPQLVKDSSHFWADIVKIDPHVFAHLVATLLDLAAAVVNRTRDPMDHA